MLRLTLELLPGGRETDARKIGIVNIGNDQTGTEDEGNYQVTLLGPLTRFSRVTHFPRTEKDAWHLATVSLASLFADDL